MGSTFLFHPLMNEVVPYNATYEFPSQATRSTKRTIKISPKNNVSSFVSGSTVRFEFPASGYLNPTKTYLAFNCRSKITAGSFVAGNNRYTPTAVTVPVAGGNTAISQLAQGGFSFQNNIASIFRRCRVLYGSLVLEDIQDYNILQRMLTDILVPSGSNQSESTMIQGIGFMDPINTPTSNLSYPNRFNYHADSGASGAVTNATVGTTVHRYAIPINTGVFQQKRLIPLKFMSSQLAIELEIAEAVDSQIWSLGTLGDAATPAIPTSAQTEIGLCEINAELLEFDSEFDRAVFTGLSTGLAIPFQSWHMTSQNIQPSNQATINIQESSRSVRYAMCGLTSDTFRDLRYDAHLFLPALNTNTPTNQVSVFQTATGNTIYNYVGASNIQQTTVSQYQWRLGGIYYPSQPVPVYGGTALLTSGNVDANYACPPVEPYLELMKVFDNQFGAQGKYFGDWTAGLYGGRRTDTTAGNTLQTSAFLMGVDFLTDRGDIIGGINAEEQNDMQFTINFNSATGGQARTLRMCVCFDNIMILGESNNMVLVN